MSQAIVQISVNGWDDELKVSSISLQQAFNRHHTFELLVLVPVEYNLSIDRLKAILGEAISIRIHMEEDDNTSCEFTGFIEELIPTWTNHQTSLKIKGYSPTIFMDSMPRFRSFSEKSIGQILQKVMHNYTGKQAPKLSSQSVGDQVPFSVQSQETDYQYLCKLADQFGKMFFYDGQQLHFGNLNEASANKIVLDLEEDIKHIELSLNSAPLSFKLKGYNPEKNSNLHYNATQEVASNNPVVNAAINKSSTYPGQDIQINYGINGQQDLKLNAQKIAAKLAYDLANIYGSSDKPSLKVGATISFKGENKILTNGSYIITEVHHYVGADNAYSNSFFAVPTGYPFSMRMQQRPNAISGPLMAIVKENNDPMNQGRVKVEFIGDEEKGLSPWLRVLAPYTKNGGMFFLPEKEDQVVVMGEGFNNEKSPFVMGAFYHGSAVADEWKDANNKKKGIALEKINFLFDDNTGKLTIEANEIEIKAKKEMTLEGGKQLTQKAGRIDLNP